MRVFAAICASLILWGAAALAQMQSQILWDVPASQQACVFDTSFSAAGATTFTAPCSGSVTMDAWGGGANGGGPNSGSAGGGGAGAFAEGVISITSGAVYNVVVGAGPAGVNGTGSNGGLTYICPTSVPACTAVLAVCSGSGLSTSNFVCADFGQNGILTHGIGGQASQSVGNAIKSNGGNGGTGSANCGGGGGGAGGPDGAGGVGTGGGTCNPSGLGGTADNTLGGAGGAGSNAGTAGTGGANATKGGGGGGATNTGTPGAGGAPGGGGGGAWNNGANSGAGAPGRIRVHIP
jgi:hypothetical protein